MRPKVHCREPKNTDREVLKMLGAWTHKNWHTTTVYQQQQGQQQKQTTTVTALQKLTRLRLDGSGTWHRRAWP